MKAMYRVFQIVTKANNQPSDDPLRRIQAPAIEALTSMDHPMPTTFVAHGSNLAAHWCDGYASLVRSGHPLLGESRLREAGGSGVRE